MYLLSPTLGNLTAAMYVLAHQGGWDEMLMVAVPVAVFAALLYAANNRASKLSNGTEAEPTVDPSEPHSAENGPVQRRTPPPQNPRRGPI